MLSVGRSISWSTVAQLPKQGDPNCICEAIQIRSKQHTVHAAAEEQLATVGHSSLEGPVTRWITRSTNGSQQGYIMGLSILAQLLI